jgi:hypothetical protein
MGMIPIFAQSPHGEELKIDCAQCHNPAGWNIEADDIKFDHSTTEFELEGAHLITDCKECHTSMIFDEAPSDCISCHLDAHSMSVGNDCLRCHTSQTWLVDNIPELHEENGFPLIGAHSSLSCIECHTSETIVRFDRVGNDCINCHREDYLATQSPDHMGSGFSTDCVECHNPLGGGWEADLIDHDFFPLTMGHDIQDCSECHTTGNFSDANPDCVSCHQIDYDQSSNPNHQAADFNTDCVSCHTTNPGWTPATFDHDELFFPIYSGEHAGEWDDCIDCHTDPSNFSIFTCITCHMNPETDEEHQGISGYIYESNACLICHPTGSAGDSFDHNNSGFPLTGSHIELDCLECHSNGYPGTPTNCEACHTPDYNGSSNPNHLAIGIPTDCVSCHTTEPDWMPASFDMHNDYYQLNGAHATIANDCASCHNGDYNNTPNTCVGCHLDDYNNTSDPNHLTSQFPTDCVVCHTESAWSPANYNHDATDFPLTGGHIGLDCLECHSGGYTNTPTECQACHLDDYNNTNNPNHAGAQFPTDCATCHTTNPGWTPANFDHDGQYFPIYSGSHDGEWAQCIDCHINSNDYTIFTCITCHTQAQTDDDHTDVTGYIYESNACFACHPDP